MNAIQEIAAALSCTALCVIIHYGIKDWRYIVQELGYAVSKKPKPVHQQHHIAEKISHFFRSLTHGWADA